MLVYQTVHPRNLTCGYPKTAHFFKGPVTELANHDFGYPPAVCELGREYLPTFAMKNQYKSQEWAT